MDKKVNAIQNPLDVIRQATEMSKSLKEELGNEDFHTALNNKLPQEGRPMLTDAYIDNRLRASKPTTALSFIDDLRKLWEAAGNPGKIIRHSPPKEDATYPTITYRILSRKVNPEFKDLKPRYRTTILHPYLSGQYIELYGQMFDVMLEFSVLSKGAEEADELIIELEDFLQTYAGYFKDNGVQEITFDSQGADEIAGDSRTPIAKRTVIYKVRFEKIIVRFLNEINQIAVKARLRNEGNHN